MKSKLFYATILATFTVTSLQMARGAEETGIWLGRVNISPTLSASVFYDNNPDEVNKARKRVMEETIDERYNKRRYEDSTVGFNIRPGLLINVPGNSWSLSGGVHYLYERDDSDYSRKPKDWSENLTLRGKTDGETSWSIGQSLSKLSYQEYDEFSQDDRLAIGVHGGLGKQWTDKTRTTLGLTFRRVDYDDDLLYDTDAYRINLSFDHRLTDKSYGILSLAAGFNRADYSSVPELEGRARRSNGKSDFSQYSLQAGVGSRATDKITYRALIGMAMLVPDYKEERLDDNTTSGKSYNDNEYDLSYDLSANWQATDRITVSVAGRSLYESSEDVRNSAVQTYTLSCNASYRLLRRWRLGGGVSYRREEYIRKVASSSDPESRYGYMGTEVNGRKRDDDQVNLHANVTFGLNRYASLFANGLYSMTSSSIEAFEFDRYRLSAGIALQY